MTVFDDPGSQGEPPDQELIDVLRRARERPPWTVTVVEDYAADPATTKAAASACTGCRRPCEESEVCATVIASEEGLLETFDRSQAYHLVESGIRRLQWRGAATVRETDEHRPNTFIERRADQ